jgi:hypothetical protein
MYVEPRSLVHLRYTGPTHIFHMVSHLFTVHFNLHSYIFLNVDERNAHRFAGEFDLSKLCQGLHLAYQTNVGPQ